MNLINAFIFLSGVSASLYHSVNRGLLSKAASLLISQNGRIAAGVPLQLNRAAFSTVPENYGKRFISTSDSNFHRELKNKEKYEILLSDRHFIGIAQAYQRNEIDYTYVPKAEKFYLKDLKAIKSFKSTLSIAPLTRCVKWEFSITRIS